MRGTSRPGDPLGPFPGWTAAAIADGEDGLSRVLWNHFDGVVALSLIGPDGLLASYPFGPVAGWTAADIAVGSRWPGPHPLDSRGSSDGVVAR